MPHRPGPPEAGPGAPLPRHLLVLGPEAEGCPGRGQPRRVQAAPPQVQDDARGGLDALEKRRQDVAVFLAEQALQIYPKAQLHRVLGDYPRTHSIRQLLALLAQALGPRPWRGSATTPGGGDPSSPSWRTSI
ncbi:MAG: HEPN domain-containing protein [Crenarchaeota archaeon]|nr:HEPN domain-containing protein [Thermoproteota archaeon]